MRKLTVFNSVSVDGFFTGKRGDLSWAHRGRQDSEWNAFVCGNASGDGTLLFGRVTYEMMASYWPTPLAIQNDPVVAEGMNRMRKVVFSTTMDKAAWSNTTLVQGGLVGHVREMKQEPGPHMAILGSGSIVSQLAQAGLIDEFQFAIVPVVLGEGKTMFEGVKEKLELKLTKSRAFANGNVLLCYEPFR